jgi:hypothetical protein
MKQLLILMRKLATLPLQLYGASEAGRIPRVFDQGQKNAWNKHAIGIVAPRVSIRGQSAYESQDLMN